MKGFSFETVYCAGQMDSYCTPCLFIFTVNGNRMTAPKKGAHPDAGFVNVTMTDRMHMMKQSHDSPVSLAESPLDSSFGLSWRRDGPVDIPVRIFGVRSAGQALPLVLYFHGGMFNCGALQDAQHLAGALSDVAIVVCVEYPLAPACQFPETVEVTFEALLWASSHAEGFGADPARIFIAGDQAGGNLAAATALVARDRSALVNTLRPLAGQILLTPMLDPSQTSASMRAAADCPCRKGWTDYLPLMSNSMHPYAAPLNSRRLGSLPQAFIITADMDPLRDEAEQYAAKLASAGVPVQVRQMEKAQGDLVNPASPQFGALVDAVAAFIVQSR
jgi:acetyl esterase/lipase